MSLKRSTVLEGNHPPNLSILETLNIFAVRANFMAEFQKYLMREGVPHEEPIQLELPIKPNMDPLEKPLYTLTAAPYHEATKGQCVTLEVISGIVVTHTTQSVNIIGSSSQRGIQSERADAALQTIIQEASLKLLDWEKIYLQLLEYKQEKQFYNLIFDTEILKKILNPNEGLYKLSIMDESEVAPTSLAELEHLEGLVITLLRKYIAKFYRIVQKQWNDEKVQLEKLKKKDHNFTNWRIHIPRNEASVIAPQIQKLIETEEIYETSGEYSGLIRVINERHLYQPLLAVVGTADISWHTTPPALENSEKNFVEDLHRYVRDQREELFVKKEVFLLRNQSRGRGIGFYQNEGFYPDFILWIIEGAKQRIVFIEPHGMVHEAIHEYNEKITFFKRLNTLSNKRFRGEHVQMDSFIISETAFPDLHRKYPHMDKQKFKELHILFRDSGNLAYLSPIFQEYIDSETLMHSPS